MKMSYRIVECQERCLFRYLTETFAYVLTVAGRSSGAVGRAELGKAFSETIQLCALAATPGTWSSSCSSSQALQADSQAGSAKGRLLQGLDQAGWTGMCSDITHAQEQWGPLASPAFEKLTICSAVCR